MKKKTKFALAFVFYVPAAALLMHLNNGNVDIPAATLIGLVMALIMSL